MGCCCLALLLEVNSWADRSASKGQEEPGTGLGDHSEGDNGGAGGNAHPQETGDKTQLSTFPLLTVDGSLFSRTSGLRRGRAGLPWQSSG